MRGARVWLGWAAVAIGLSAVVAVVILTVVWREARAEAFQIRVELHEAERELDAATVDAVVRRRLASDARRLHTRIADLRDSWLCDRDTVDELAARVRLLSSDVATADELASSEEVLQRVAARSLDVETDPDRVRATTTEASTLRERIEALGNRASRLEQRVSALLHRLSQVEAQLAYAQRRAEYYECRATVMSYEAEAARAAAVCSMQFATYHECGALSERNGSTALFVGCGVGAAIVAILTGGIGAGAIAACAAVGGVARQVTLDDCGTEPTCSSAPEAALTEALARDGLDSLPECTEPQEPSETQLLLAWVGAGKA